jgi:hypothetical protein
MVIVGLFLGGCQKTAGPPPTSSPDDLIPKHGAPAEVEVDWAPSFVLIEGSGGGVIVGEGLVLTTARTLRCAIDRFSIIRSGGRATGFPQIVGLDSRHDLALVRVDGLPAPPWQISSAVGALGDSVAVRTWKEGGQDVAKANLWFERTGDGFRYLGLRLEGNAFEFRRGSVVTLENELFGLVVSEGEEGGKAVWYVAPSTAILDLISRQEAIPIEAFKQELDSRAVAECD